MPTEQTTPDAPHHFVVQCKIGSDWQTISKPFASQADAQRHALETVQNETRVVQVDETAPKATTPQAPGKLSEADCLAIQQYAEQYGDCEELRVCNIGVYYLKRIVASHKVVAAEKAELEKQLGDRNLAPYEKELEELSAFIQKRHYMGEVKHVGLCEVVLAAKQVIEEQEQKITDGTAACQEAERRAVKWEKLHDHRTAQLNANAAAFEARIAALEAANARPGAEGGEFDSRGVSMIASERRRQIDEEGWTAEHDDRHAHGEIANAAACYAATKPIYVCPMRAATGQEIPFEFGETSRNRRERNFIPDFNNATPAWPWDAEWDKRDKHPRLRQLAIAGALVADEIDRLLRENDDEPDGFFPKPTPELRAMVEDARKEMEAEKAARSAADVRARGDEGEGEMDRERLGRIAHDLFESAFMEYNRHIWENGDRLRREHWCQVAEAVAAETRKQSAKELADVRAELAAVREALAKHGLSDQDETAPLGAWVDQAIQNANQERELFRQQLATMKERAEAAERLGNQLADEGNAAMIQLADATRQLAKVRRACEEGEGKPFGFSSILFHLRFLAENKDQPLHKWGAWHLRRLEAALPPSPVASAAASGEEVVMPTDIRAWQRLVGEWAVVTFPNATHQSHAEHLKEEAQELLDAETPEKRAEELADVVLLAFGYAHKSGIDLQAALERKHAICRKRKWGAPNENGVSYHIKEDTTAPQDMAAAPEPPAFKCPKCGCEQLYDDPGGYQLIEPLICANMDCGGRSTWAEVEAAKIGAAKSRRAKAAELAKPGGVFDQAIEEVFGKPEVEAAKGKGETGDIPLDQIPKLYVVQLGDNGFMHPMLFTSQQEAEAANPISASQRRVVIGFYSPTLFSAQQDLAATRAALTAAEMREMKLYLFSVEVERIANSQFGGGETLVRLGELLQALKKLATQPQSAALDPLRAVAIDA